MSDVIDDLEAAGADFFETPTLETPKTPPDAHRAVVTSVTARHLPNEKQTAIISINLSSRDVPTLDAMSLDVFVPKGFEMSFGSSEKFDPRTLPEEEGNKQQTSYRLGIGNSDKDATLQRLVFNSDSVARKAGRDPIGLDLNRSPKSLDEYTENLNKMLQGVEVVILRRERGGDNPAFAHQLQVRDILSSDAYETNPKRFSKYVLAWE